MARSTPIGLCLAAVLLSTAAPARAHWSAGASGAGAASVATMPAGQRPSGSASGQTVTVSFAQSTFAGANLGTYSLGAYRVRRYAASGGSAIVPGAGTCASDVTGSAATLQCAETSVPYGTWTYTVTPLLGSFTGSESPASTTVTVALAPPSSVTATAAAAGRIDVAWTTVSGAAGYNVYRRTASGSFDYASPLNGATPLTGTSWADTSTVDGTAYRYVVRTVVTGSGGAAVEGSSSAEAAATADATPPPAPSAAAVTSGGNLISSTICGVAAGTRYVNAAGKAAAGISATIATPEAGETVVFSATTPGSSALGATASATGTTVATTLDVTTLLDGAITLTARTKDAAGNLSAATQAAGAAIKDVVVPPLSGLTYTDAVLGAPDTLAGTSECGARIVATETTGPNPGTVYPSAAGFQIASGTTFSGLALDAIFGVVLGVPYSYSVVATDLAGNARSAVTISGADHL